jgi:hypothetical protein
MTDPDFALGDTPAPTALAPIPSRLRPGRPPRQVSLPATEPPEQLHALAAEYVGATILGALTVGLVAGLLLPRPRRGNFSRMARAGLAMAGEVGLAIAARSLSRKAPDETRAAPSAHRQSAADAASAPLAWLRGAATLIAAARGKAPRK